MLFVGEVRGKVTYHKYHMLYNDNTARPTAFLLFCCYTSVSTIPCMCKKVV